MPYSKVHYFMLALLPVTLLAFWQSYFGRLSDASIAHHIHGITGTAWILLIALQSWLIHHGKAHRLIKLRISAPGKDTQSNSKLE